MPLGELVKVIKPPEQPLEVADDWPQIEGVLGTPLPLDFKECIGAFGSGVFADFVWVFNPYTANSNLNLLTQAPIRLRALSEIRAMDPKEMPYRLFPELGGLLPWGTTDNGDGLYWKTGAAANDWPVVVNAGREPHYEEFSGGMTTFLARVFDGTWRCAVFPDNFAQEIPGSMPRGFRSRSS